MKDKPIVPVMILGLLLMSFMQANVLANDDDKACNDRLRYTFSWSLLNDCNLTPRGGTSEGAPVRLDPELHPGWLALQKAGLTDFERDRLAILAMAGPYRASFEFLETVGYTPEFSPDRPYHSWGTEYIYVVEDRPDFISLQHIMVMFFAEGAKIIGPVVMKHWRQDWEYQKRELLVFTGNRTWKKQTLPDTEVKGTWAQSVYHVDDGPRYESYGRWEHKPNFSTWKSALTWRPLPRREYSVRNDYQILEGYNRHTILPHGWVHEEENYKLKLNAQGRPDGTQPYLAKEQGVNRYERITGFDFSAGDQYWERTKDYWRVVREEWEKVFLEHPVLQERELKDDAEPLYSSLFEYAAKIERGEDIGNIRARVRQALDYFYIYK